MGIEWITLKNIGCDIDISKCYKLIGVQLLQNMKCKQIIWPKSDDLIPFVALCDGRGIHDNQWRDLCVNNQLNVKYVCLLKERIKKEKFKRIRNGGNGNKNGMRNGHNNGYKKRKNGKLSTEI